MTARGRAAPRLVLNPAVRVLWRSVATVQLELGGRALVLDDLDQSTVSRLLGQQGVDPDWLDDRADPGDQDALDVLYAAGFLVSVAPTDEDPGTRSAAQVPRLAADLGALRVRHGSAAGRVLAGRRAATVSVRGGGRLAALVAALLAAAGVGQLDASGTPLIPGSRRDAVRIADAAPGGYLTSDEGRPPGDALADAIHRAAPEARLGSARAPDLVLLVSEDPLGEPTDDELRAELHARDLPHLSVRAGGDLGTVGPLVVPGRTSCLRCADLHRTDRDPAWSALAAQLTVPRRGTPPADVAVCSVIAGLAVLQALAWLDGEQPAAVGATLEFRVPGWRVRRRSWSAHPSCGCGAIGRSRSAVQPTSEPPEWAQWPA